MSLSGKAISFNTSDTIAAIATASGPSGISVIRISGRKAFSIVDKLFSGKIKPSQAPSHTIHFGLIFNPISKNLLDEVLLSIFIAPKSYTGENMIEISCHGGDFVASQILKLLTKLGARLAEPGEFTKRRVLAGKMDITQAEAVLDLVQATNESSYRSAIDQLKGKLSGYIQNTTNELATVTAKMENLLEFEVDKKQTKSELKKITSQLKSIRINLEQTIKKNEQLKFLRAGIYCVIVGRPNVGKSSLFNRLGDVEKAIVTEIPGTTRDSIEQTITINGLLLHLVDTAGLKVLMQAKANNKIEAMGIEKSKDWLEAADLVLAVFDNSSSITKEDRLVYDAIKQKPHLCVLNKIDLKPAFNYKFLNREKWYFVSAKYNKGVNHLKNAIADNYKRKSPTSNNNCLYLNTRHIDTLNRVLALVRKSEPEKYLDVSIMNLRNALDILGNITSAVTNEQILDLIFAQFCIGK